MKWFGSSGVLLKISLGVVLLLILPSSCTKDDVQQRVAGKGGDAQEARPADNRPPYVISATILPTKPSPKSELAASYKAADPEGDFINYTFRWYVDNELVQDGPSGSLTPGAYRRNSEVYVEVIPSDKYSSGEAFRSEVVVIGNLPPVIKAVTLMPPNPVAGDVITATAEGEDPDGDTIRYSYQWYVNTTPYTEPSEAHTFNTGHLKKGDRVSVVVYASDGEAAATPFVSDSKLLLNRPPRIISKPAYNLQGDIYTYQVNAVDPDGDRLIFSLKKAPSNMTIDSASGAIRWQVPGKIEERQEVFIEIAVEDGDGGYHSQEYSIILRPK